MRPIKVLETIYNVFAHRHSDDVRNLPIAVSISKGDKIAQEMIQKNLDDIQFLQDKSGFFFPKFNATDYNSIHDAIKTFVQRNLPDRQVQKWWVKPYGRSWRSPPFGTSLIFETIILPGVRIFWFNCGRA